MTEMDDKKSISGLEKQLRDSSDYLKRCSEAEKSLLQAGIIQRSILPEKPPVVPGYDIAAMMQPARGVGGDFFDYFPGFSGPDITGIVVGDVMDKGVAAAMYMSLVHGMIHAGLSLSDDFTADSLLLWLNSRLMEISDSKSYVTMLGGVLDSKNHTFSFARAGHIQPLLYNSSGRITYCGDAKIGQPLGMFQNPKISKDKIKIPKGSFITIYSDGLSDETDLDDQPLGIFKLTEIISDYKDLPAEGICSSVMERLKEYRAGTPPYDDCTLMVIKRES